MPPTEPYALQIRDTLAGIDPPVWRRLVVPSAWHLGELHLAIQAAFNWWNCHVHEFRIGGLRYGALEVADEDGFADDPRLFDESEVRLRDFGREHGAAFTYLYDFGDDWHHFVEIEAQVAVDLTPRLAACIAGSRARPPEDVGGVGGYENFLAIMADPTDPEHVETKRWCGGHFDPEWFDLAVTDKDVKNALRANVRRRLHQPSPKRPPRAHRDVKERVGQIVRIPQRTCSALTPVPSEGAHDRGQAASEWLHAETDIARARIQFTLHRRACIAG